jgi:protein gp37
MNTTSIELTAKTWNPTTGCDKISAGCKNCYASVMARRLIAMNNSRYQMGLSLLFILIRSKKPENGKKDKSLL